MNYKTNTEVMSITIFRIIKLYFKGPKTMGFQRLFPSADLLYDYISRMEPNKNSLWFSPKAVLNKLQS